MRTSQDPSFPGEVKEADKWLDAWKEKRRLWSHYSAQVNTLMEQIDGEDDIPPPLVRGALESIDSAIHYMHDEFYGIGDEYHAAIGCTWQSKSGSCGCMDDLVEFFDQWAPSSLRRGSTRRYKAGARMKTRD